MSNKKKKILDLYSKYLKENLSSKPFIMSLITAGTCLINYHNPELASIIIDAGVFSGVVILTLYRNK